MPPPAQPLIVDEATGLQLATAIGLVRHGEGRRVISLLDKPAVSRALELLKEIPNSVMPQQFENPANIDVHVRTTAAEIAADFPEGLDALELGRLVLTADGSAYRRRGAASRSHSYLAAFGRYFPFSPRAGRRSG